MKEFALLAVLTISPLGGLAQEPSTYKPEDFKEGDVPKGMTAEEYMQQVYEERHYKIKVTFRVVGEDGMPIPDADIDVGIDSLLHSDGHNNYRGKTDAEGLFPVESRGRGCTDVLVEKTGYYPSRPEVQWDGDLNPGGEEMHQNGGFRPWNPTIDVVLKKVGNPVPMLVRRGNRTKSWFKLDAEDVGQVFEWDLIEGDWVAPEGTGKVADLVVRYEANYTDESNYSASISIGLGNPDDGFIPIRELRGEESLLKFPREAPEGGYVLERLEYAKKLRDVDYALLPEEKPKGYLLRLRTAKDDKDKFISAIYGKITGPFDFQTGGGESLLKFDYYLNLTPNDRNLEYDQKNNLAPEADKDLRWPP